jgi:sulfopyruvate decarboxylase TPP-binding subunit
MSQSGLRASRLILELEKQGVTHVVTLPDSETSGMYDAIQASDAISLVPVCREGEAIPIAAGLWAAGKIGVVIIQNSGLFESGDALRGLAIGVQLPIVMFIGYRGYTRHGDTPDSSARFLEPYLHLWRVPFYVLEHGGDIDRIGLAFDEADRTQMPVAVLVGAEYEDEEIDAP